MWSNRIFAADIPDSIQGYLISFKNEIFQPNEATFSHCIFRTTRSKTNMMSVVSKTKLSAASYSCMAMSRKIQVPTILHFLHRLLKILIVANVISISSGLTRGLCCDNCGLSFHTTCQFKAKAIWLEYQMQVELHGSAFMWLPQLFWSFFIS